MNDRNWLNEFLNGRFREKFPLYAAILARIPIIHNPAVEVACICLERGRLYIHVNFDFFFYRSRKKFLAGVLIHEVNHAYLGHLTDGDILEAKRDNLHGAAISCEISANEYISPEHAPLPRGTVKLEQYRKYGIRPDQSTMERYAILDRAMRDGRLKIDRPMAEDCIVSGNHHHHDAAKALEEILREAMEDAGDDDSRIAGMRAREILRSIESPGGASRLDWKSELRRFVRMVTRSDEWRLSLRRPNRRFPHLAGIVPGRIYPRVHEKPELLVAIDTSGSISPDVLNLFGNELAVLYREAAIRVCECDHMIRRVYDYTGRLTECSGGGGTDFRPVFEKSFLARFRGLAGIVYLTDGCGVFPDSPPPIPCLWVVTSDTAPHVTCPWGWKIILEV